ncbi:hypothetical protein CW745_14810 [Psychromonas sp. psych-6C06]|uniref:hypothetical protein n=1 Tax=Psychromonas sp. psych-6C06 TaxID=2058089 RepID=UPI000C3400B5|nr:hypothetical protein [Psychromonas sp. psych-6C06]PKF60478.1 hypothetical protein CW745_14810 [Psychromonas sp. psych-6C06]
MKFQQTLTSLFVIGALSACGGSSSSNSVADEATTSVSGKAADGYLRNATVCLDLDKNKMCDAGEPSATTGEGGAFTLEGVTQAEIDENPLLVIVTKGETVDEDYLDDANGGVVQKAYTLSAPAGYTFISPLTTLVQNEVENGNSIEQAESSVQGKLGTTLALDKDYVEAKASGDDAAEFKKLHQIAQVTANVIATNMDALKTTAETEGVELDELVSLITTKVFAALATITQTVESAALDGDDNFDVESIATDINEDHVAIETEGLKEQVAQNEATKTSMQISLAELIKDGGIHWFWSEEDDDTIFLEFGMLKLDSAGDVIDDEYEIDENDEQQVLTFEVDPKQLILTDKGWVAEDDNIKTITLNADGSITLNMGTTALNETVTAKEIAIEGLSVQAALQNSGGDGTWAEAVSSTLKFPAGSKAYQLDFTPSSASSPYGFNLGDWCEEGNPTRWEQLGESCNGVDWDGEPATTLDPMIINASASTPPSMAENSIYIAGLTENQVNGDIIMQVIQGGKADFYKRLFYPTDSTTKLASGTWKDITVHGKVLREFSVPSSVANIDTNWSDVNEDNNKFFHTVYNGFVRVVWEDTEDGDDGELVFNEVAKNTILTNASRDMLPEKEQSENGGETEQPENEEETEIPSGTEQAMSQG